MNVAEYTHARLVEAIDTMTPTEFSKAPGRYFTRNRKVDFKKAVLLSITASKGTIFKDIRKFYTVTECQPNMAPSPSALTQQLGKLSSQAFPEVLRRFNNQFEHKTFHGYTFLEWLRRQENNPKTYGGLFFALCEDVQDMELSDALRSPMSLFMETINGYGTEDTETIKSKVSNWIASQSRYIKGLFNSLCWES